MKKIFMSLMVGIVATSYAFGVSTVESYSAANLVKEINEALVDPSVTTLAVSGKTTLSGEVEINGAAGVTLDINAITNANLITIDQTAVAGPGSKPFIAITDARTGTSADVAAEATLVITAAGAYGLSVADGIFNIEGEIDCTGDMTLDPAGDDLIVDATVDATAYTADAASGIDVESAGALDIGNTTATSIDYGSSAVTAHTFMADGTGDGEVVLPLLSVGDGEINDMSAAKLTAATVASAIGGSAITNLAGGNIASGDIASDRMTANGVVVSDFAAAGDVLIGTGSGTFGAVTGVGETNFTFLSATATTGRMWFSTGGILTNVVQSGE